MSKLIVKISFFARHLFVKLRNRPSIARKMSQKVNSLRGHGQGGLGLLVKQVLSRKTRGIGLIETLVGGAIGAVVVAGSMKSLQLSLESNLVAKATLAEMDIHHTIRQALQGSKQDCLNNFTPKTQADPNPYAQGLYGADREWGIGEVFQLYKDGAKVLEKKQTFKGSLEIVKMSLKGVKPTTDPNSKRITHGGPAVTRQFVVYYKKVNMGSYSTLAGNPCTESDLSGCYFEQCEVTLRVDNDGVSTTTPPANFQVCNSGTCANYGSHGSGPPPCYKVDNDSGKERTLVGCGADSAQGIQTVAIGFNAGRVNTGNYSTFLGAKAGGKNTSANANTFVGQAAGQENTTGQNNTFVGTAAGRENTSAGNNTFLGDRAGEKVTTQTGNTFVGREAGKNTPAGNNNTAVGYLAGHRITGHENTMIGHKAGRQGTTTVTNKGGNVLLGAYAGTNNEGADNIFLGWSAGYENTSGSKNIFIGNNAGKKNTVGDHNIFIGNNVGERDGMHNIHSLTNINNRLLVKRNKDSSGNTRNPDPSDLTFDDSEIRVLGTLKVCSETGTNCKTVILFQNIGKCDSGKYLKGFNSDGTKDCQPISFCPQSQHFWTPENICHKCPRDSPLYRENQNPACVPCPANSNYILTGTNKNTCCPTGYYDSDGMCCPTGFHNSNGLCCPSGHSKRRRAAKRPYFFEGEPFQGRWVTRGWGAGDPLYVCCPDGQQHCCKNEPPRYSYSEWADFDDEGNRRELMPGCAWRQLDSSGQTTGIQFHCDQGYVGYNFGFRENYCCKLGYVALSKNNRVRCCPEGWSLSSAGKCEPP